MCGISGIWRFDRHELNEETLRKFNDTMHHRGPDGQGTKIFSQHGLGLAHRRLSILDVSEAGAQPMSDADEMLWMTFNGEIFNFIEIKEELKILGHAFKTQSDTEVILAAYNEWGKDCFQRFNGMWAIVIWDERSQELTLCRDRFGIKPLYYLVSDSQFAFASETNSFKDLEGFNREFDSTKSDIALHDTYALEGNGHTLFKDIYQLLPGHLISLKRGGKVQEKRWYDIREQISSREDSYQRQVKEYKKLFADCCALRMRSDVSLATALSGGVDSTAVYSMVHHLMSEKTNAQRVPENWQQAFVQTFPGTDVDERIWAEKAVSHTGGVANYLVPDYGSLSQNIVSSTKHFDAISTTPIIALMGVYQGMKDKGVTVSLDGHGVDEMLFGYKNLVHSAHQYHTWNKSEKEALEIAQVLTSLFPEEQRAAKLDTYRKEIQKVAAQRSSLSSKLKKAYRSIRPKANELRSIDLLASRSDKPYDFSRYNELDRPVLQDFFMATLPSLLRNFDKASMMSSIEIRMPFMDYRLVEMSFSLPISSKLGGGYTKRILRDAMLGIMPEANRVRTYKVGLGAPTGRWMHNELKELVHDTIASEAFRQSSLFDGRAISDIFDSLKDDKDPANIDVWKHLNAHWIS